MATVKEVPGPGWPGYSASERLVFLGRALTGRNSPQAAAWFRRALEVQPELVSARQGLAQAQSRKRNAEDALRDAQAYADRYPDDALGPALVGKALARLRQWPEAEAALLEALRRGHHGARQDLERLYGQTRQDDKLKSLYPRGATALPPTSYPAYLNERYFAQEDAELRALLERDPDDAAAHFALAEILRYGPGSARNGKEEALEHLLEAARLAPGDPVTLYEAANLMQTTDEDEDAERMTLAIDMLEQAVRIDPGFTEAHMALGTCHFRLGRHTQALPHFRKAAESHPAALPWLTSTICALQQPKEAMQALIHEMEDDPRTAHRRECASLLEHAGDRGTALALLEDMVILRPQNPYDHWHYAACLERAGRTDEVAKRRRRALACRPTTPDYQRAMGHFLKGLGYHEQAAEWYRKATAEK